MYSETELLKTLVAGDLNDGGGEKEPWATESKAVERLDVICELCNVAVVNFSERLEDVIVEPVRSYCQKNLRLRAVGDFVLQHEAW